MSGFIAPTGYYRFLNSTGQPIIDYSMSFYRDVARNQLKAVFYDPELTNPIPNPINSTIIDATGRTPIIFWGDDELYYVEVRDASGLLIESWEHAPITSPAGDQEQFTASAIDNQIINGQFFVFDKPIIENFHANSFVEVAKKWDFIKNNTTAKDKVIISRFNLGEAIPEATPTYYLRYQSTTQGTGENFKAICQRFKSVRDYEQKTVTVSFDARSPTSEPVELLYEQYFGTGGTPSATNQVAIKTFPLTPNWAKVSATFTISGLNGKIVGTNNDDEFRIYIRFSNDTICAVDIVNVYKTISDKVKPYPFQRYEEVVSISDSEVPVGTLLPYCGFTSPSGFLFANGSAVNRSAYVNLFNNITFNITGSTSNLSKIISTPTNITLLRSGWYLEGEGVPSGAMIVGTQMAIACDTTVSSTTISHIVSKVPLQVGWTISGAGIPEGAIIATITSGGIATLSVAATATATGVTLDVLKDVVAISKAATASASAVPMAISPYGFGDGTTTYNLPDTRGRAIIGAGIGASLRFTGNTTASSNIVSSISSNSPLSIGAAISGAGIPDATTISGLHETIKCDTTIGSPTITSIVSAATLQLGWPISGAGIPSGAVISTISVGGVATISVNATATAAGVTLDVLKDAISISNNATITAANVPLEVPISERIMGALGGEESVSLTADNNGPHTHSITTLGYTPPFFDARKDGDDTMPMNSVYHTDSSGLGKPHENMPPFIVAPYIIKY